MYSMNLYNVFNVPIYFQGSAGQPGPPGQQGPPGEGVPGPKVGKKNIRLKRIGFFLPSSKC